MHIRTCSNAPIDSRIVLSTNDDAPEVMMSDYARLTAHSAGTANGHIHCRLSLILALGFTIVGFTGMSSGCRADQLKELAEKAGIRILADGDSSATAEEESRTGIPLNEMTPENRQRAQMIIRERSQFRRLPTLQYTIDEPIFRYLLIHPDVAVSTWRVMGISRFEMWQTGPNEYEALAIDGSEGIADILYQDNNQMVFICQGSYHNPLLPRPMQASALICFRATYVPNADGTHTVTQKADVFVRFPSSSVSAIAKVLTPVLHSLMDRNLFEISLYGSMMSRAVRDEPEWVVQVAQQLEGVLPQRKGELIDVARKFRGADTRVSRYAMPTADRSLISSPQLLFLDPPKDDVVAVVPAGSIPAVTGNPAPTKVTDNQPAAGSRPVPARRASASTSGNLMIITAPAGPSKPVDLRPAPSDRMPNTRIQRSDDGFTLQPVVVPPTGPTATGPVGSESPGSGD